MRHELVHPKMKPVKVVDGTFMDGRFKVFNPRSGARLIVRVAEAASVLSEASGRETDQIVSPVLLRREAHLVFGVKLTNGLPEPPTRHSRRLTAPKKRYLTDEVAKRARQTLPARALRYPLMPPPIVPQELMALLNVLAPLPGTATGIAPPPSGTPAGIERIAGSKRAAVFTWSFREALACSDEIVVVRISIGKPKWLPPADAAAIPFVNELAPFGAFQIEDDAEFERVYR